MYEDEREYEASILTRYWREKGLYSNTPNDPVNPLLSAVSAYQEQGMEVEIRDAVEFPGDISQTVGVFVPIGDRMKRDMSLLDSLRNNPNYNAISTAYRGHFEPSFEGTTLSDKQQKEIMELFQEMRQHPKKASERFIPLIDEITRGAVQDILQTRKDEETRAKEEEEREKQASIVRVLFKYESPSGVIGSISNVAPNSESLT